MVECAGQGQSCFYIKEWPLPISILYNTRLKRYTDNTRKTQQQQTPNEAPSIAINVHVGT